MYELNADANGLGVLVTPDFERIGGSTYRKELKVCVDWRKLKTRYFFAIQI